MTINMVQSNRPRFWWIYEDGIPCEQGLTHPCKNEATHNSDTQGYFCQQHYETVERVWQCKIKYWENPVVIPDDWWGVPF